MGCSVDQVIFFVQLPAKRDSEVGFFIGVQNSVGLAIRYAVTTSSTALLASWEFSTPCPWELRQKGHSTRRVFADQESTNAVGRGSIIDNVRALDGADVKPLFWSTYQEFQRTGETLSLSELLLASSPRHHSLGADTVLLWTTFRPLRTPSSIRSSWTSLATVQQESLGG